ncbi:MerR family transcriptional regulator [Dactylosporangium salmoneum]
MSSNRGAYPDAAVADGGAGWGAGDSADAKHATDPHAGAPSAGTFLSAALAGADDVGYRGPTACHAAGISYRQLDYWARTGLVVPSVRDATGSGSQRLYSFRDIVVLKVVKRLLDAGVSLQNIRKAIDTLRSRGVGDLAGITLISDGTTVYECRSPEEVVDLLQGGQGVFGIAISGAFKEIEGTLSHLPAEAATTGEEVPAPPATGTSGSDDAFAGGDELAMRRARRRAG